eukprot:COSAG01_NODE_68278_length_264_cov_1.236364_1_plen_61_part_10
MIDASPPQDLLQQYLSAQAYSPFAHNHFFPQRAQLSESGPPDCSSVASTEEATLQPVRTRT